MIHALQIASKHAGWQWFWERGRHLAGRMQLKNLILDRMNRVKRKVFRNYSARQTVNVLFTGNSSGSAC